MTCVSLAVVFSILILAIAYDVVVNATTAIATVTIVIDNLFFFFNEMIRKETG